MTKNLNGEISSVGQLNTEVGTAINPFSTSPSDPKNWREWLARGLGDGARLSDDFDVDLD